MYLKKRHDDGSAHYLSLCMQNGFHSDSYSHNQIHCTTALGAFPKTSFIVFIIATTKQMPRRQEDRKTGINQQQQQR